jgi:type II secretory pathway pseudopilin PulG
MTLIELLVAGVIGVILVGVMLVIYRMYDTQVRENSARLALQMQYAVVVEQIAAHAHGAHKIFAAEESYTEACLPGSNPFNKVLFYDNVGIPFAGIGRSNDTMIECDPSLTWKSFEAGAGPVLVDPVSLFGLNGCRNALTLNLRLKRPEGDTVFYTGPAKEVFVCRN